MFTSTAVRMPFGLETNHSTKIDEALIACADTVGAEGTEREVPVRKALTFNKSLTAFKSLNLSSCRRTESSNGSGGECKIIHRPRF